MADTMKPREPGDPGSTQGQIKTPMCSENVSRGNTPGTETYKGMPETSGGGSKLIDGPGANAKWDTQISITGSNLKGKY